MRYTTSTVAGQLRSTESVASVPDLPRAADPVSGVPAPLRRDVATVRCAASSLRQRGLVVDLMAASPNEARDLTGRVRRVFGRGSPNIRFERAGKDKVPRRMRRTAAAQSKR